MKRLSILTALLTLLSLSISCHRLSSIHKETQETRGGVKRYVLDNGMVVILKENHSSKVVAFQAWVKVGSRNETELTSGISHLIEHMLFKGTTERGMGEIAKEVEGAGGDINAYTSFDQTVFHITISSHFREVGLDVLADAVKNSSFDPAELEREKFVVIEEIKRSHDTPRRRIQNLLFETAYRIHPYRRPILGTEELVKGFPRENIIEYYKRWYVPNNIVFVVVGDFQDDTVMEKISEAFKDFDTKPPASAKIPQEPPQRSLRWNIITDNIKEAHLAIGFHNPDINDKDLHAVDLLSTILGDGESSRLGLRIKNQMNLVRSIYSYSYTPADPGMLVVGCSLEPGMVPETLKEIMRELARIKYEDISLKELEKARLTIKRDFIHRKETMQGQARGLGFYEATAGDINFELNYLKGIELTSPEDVMTTARKYLTPENLSVVVLLPEGEDSINGEDIEETIKLLTDEEGPAYDGIRVSGRDELKKFILPNGATLIVHRDHEVPIVSLQAVFLGGLRLEDQKTNGIFNLLSRMFTKGTKNYSQDEIAKKMEGLGGSIEGFSGRNTFGLNATIMSDNFKQGWGLFIDVLKNPSFPEDEIKKQKKQMTREIRAKDDNLAQLTLKLFRDTLFDNHPYGMDVLGSEDSVNSLNRDDLSATYAKYVTPSNLVLAVVGDIEDEETTSMIISSLTALEGEPVSIPIVHVEPPAKTKRKAEIFREKEQAHLVLGFQGPTITSRDRLPLRVLETVLTNQGGRMFVELRDKRSLAYALSFFCLPGVDPGYMGAYMGVSPERVDEAVEGVVVVLSDIVENNITRDELEDAKRYLIGRHAISLQSTSDRAFQMSLDERYGLGHDFFRIYDEKIMKVTLKDVHRVARKYINLDAYTLAVVRPQKK